MLIVSCYETDGLYPATERAAHQEEKEESLKFCRAEI